LEDALVEAQAAAALAPRSVPAPAELGEILQQLKRPEEARRAFQAALDAAQTVHPEFQSDWVPGLKKAVLAER
jgi:Flp pilus assembly protein TadD